MTYAGVTRSCSLDASGSLALGPSNLQYMALGSSLSLYLQAGGSDHLIYRIRNVGGTIEHYSQTASISVPACTPVRYRMEIFTGVIVNADVDIQPESATSVLSGSLTGVGARNIPFTTSGSIIAHADEAAEPDRLELLVLGQSDCAAEFSVIPRVVDVNGNLISDCFRPDLVPITVSVQSSQPVYLWDFNGSSGTTLNMLLGEQAFLTWEGGPPGTLDSAVITASIGDVTARKVVPLTCPPVAGPELDHFLVWTEPDTVEYGSAAAVHIQGKDQFNNNIELPSGTLVHFALNADERFGHLTYAGRTGKTIADVPYQSAREGVVTYVASGDNPVGLNPQRVTVGVTSGVKAGVGAVWSQGALNYTHFRQSDPLWGEQPYDTYINRIVLNPSGSRDTIYYKISRKGCAVTGMAMVLKAFGVETDPGSLNTWMTDNEGFDGAAVVWESINRFPGNLQVKKDKTVGKGLARNESNQLSKMDPYLLKGLPILAEVFNPSTKSQHWVLVYGKRDREYRIIDPGGYANRNSLAGAYQNTVYRFIVYSPKR